MTAAQWNRRSVRAQNGVVLVVALFLLVAVTTVAVGTMATAALELSMAANQHAQSIALQAAESGIEQALAVTSFATDPSALAAQYVDPDSPNPTPRRGSGTPIEGCDGQSSSPAERCEYFLRFAETTTVPGERDPPDLQAFHFVVDSFGVGARGAAVTLQAGFYVVAPAGSSGPLCRAEVAACPSPVLGHPVRTFWRQRGAD